TVPLPLFRVLCLTELCQAVGSSSAPPRQWPRASFERADVPLTWTTICPIVRALGGGATDGGTFGLAVVLGRRGFDLRQCAPQGRALPRHRRGHRGPSARSTGARARFRLRRSDPFRQGGRGRRGSMAVRGGRDGPRLDGGPLCRQSAHQDLFAGGS